MSQNKGFSNRDNIPTSRLPFVQIKKVLIYKNSLAQVKQLAPIGYIDYTQINICKVNFNREIKSIAYYRYKSSRNSVQLIFSSNQ